MVIEAPPQEHAFRVFISSTFRDMHEEREVLIKYIIPQLRKLCEERGMTCTEVDLRWGITEEQAERGEVLHICLAEIERCRPYFIALLGERYGSVSPIPKDVIKEHSWLSRHSGKSVTELEIIHGALANPARPAGARFYFRDSKYLEQIPAEQQAHYLDQDQSARDKLGDLKKRIRQSGLAVREDYANPRQLGEWVLKDLTTIIDQFSFGPPPGAFDQEAVLHESFARSRSIVYVERPKYFERLDAHIFGASQPLIILGEPGVGKSALLANWLRHHRQSHPDDYVLIHFIGATADSSNWAVMLRRILNGLKQHYNIEADLPDKPEDLPSVFANWLQIASARGRTVLVIDALNQLEDREGALDLVWLPTVIPDNVRLIASSLPGRPLDELTKRGWPTFTVRPLCIAERQQLIRSYLAHHAKTLTEDRLRHIAVSPQAASPLYLRALLGELRVFGIYEQLDERIDYYLAAPDASVLYQRILQRYEEDYDIDGTGLVTDVMSLLWASRRGLSESELLDLMGRDGQPLPHARWSPLYLAAEESLICRGSLIGFSHQYLRQAVAERYLVSAESRRAGHRRIAQYFSKREMGPRMFDELPWQLAEVEDWPELNHLLTEPNFMQAFYTFSAIEYGSCALTLMNRSGTDAARLYRGFLRNPKKFKIDTLNIVHTMLTITGSLNEAAALSEHILDVAEEAGELEVVGKALLMRIASQKASGSYDYQELLDRAEHIFRDLGSRQSLARCLAHRADFHKYHRGELQDGIKFHQEEAKLLREIGKRDSLWTCLNNQAVTYGRLREPERQLALHLEAERIARSLGDTDLIAQSEANLGMFHLQASLIQCVTWRDVESDEEGLSEAGQFLVRFGTLPHNLRKGWGLLKSAESRFRALMKPHSLAGVLRRQVEMIGALLQFRFSEEVEELTDLVALLAIPKAREARELYLRFKGGRRNEVKYMEQTIEEMTRWVETQWVERAFATQRSGLRLGDLMSSAGLEHNQHPLSEDDITREFALFVLHQESLQKPD